MRFARVVIAAIRYEVEHFFVLCVEVLRRARERFDPDNHSAGRRIRRVVAGKAQKDTRKFAIFMLWCDGPVPVFTQTIIDALARSDFQLVVVTNRTLDPRAVTYVLERASLLIERTNKGRDFGAYKDGIEFVLARHPDAERMIVANDSLYYLPNGLDELIKVLDDERHDVVGVSEVFEHHYHVASFMMAFGVNVLRSTAFRQFWADYLPLSTRRWAILRGEGRLSAMLVKSGFSRHIIYPAGALAGPLAQRLPAELPKLFMQVPKYSRRELLRKWGVPKYDAKDLRYPENFLAELGTTRSAEQIAADFVEAVIAHNQMHVGGVLFRLLLGLPMMKRDIVYREIFTLDELPVVLDGIDEPMRTTIATELTQRGDPSRLSALDRAYHRHSAI